MEKQIKLAGWFGIGSREVEIKAIAGRDGVLVRAYLPTDDMMTLGGELAEKLLTWDAVEADAEAIKNTANDLAGEVVRAALPSKKDGEVYSA